MTAGARSSRLASAPNGVPPTRTVTEVAHQINDLLEGDPRLRNIRVSGEVSNLRLSPAGHHFFRLRDADAALGCVLFRYSTGARHLEDGARVICTGRASLYVNRGDLQIVATNVEPAGAGELQARLDALKRKLESEGLFEDSRKRPLPRFPARIAVITAEGGSVLQDIINVLRRRYPIANVLLLPVAVQGADAASDIQDALSALDGISALRRIDVAILARGGGSLEDLMAFNDESVARAIFACSVPIVSGVGHETDTTIADLVADRRAPTPSAAAELVSLDQVELRNGIRAGSARMTSILSDRLQFATERHQQTTDRIGAVMSTTLRLSEERLVHNKRQLRNLRPDPSAWEREVATARTRLKSATERVTDLRSERLRGLTAQLRALSHLDTLRRGFAIVRDADGAVVTRAAYASAGLRYKLTMADGMIAADAVDIQLDDES